MIHLHVIAEGKSEEEFVRKVLAPHLAHFEIFVQCQQVHTGGNKTHPIKGGLGRVPRYKPIARALERWIESDRERTDVYYSTMLDLYAFPKDTESPFTEGIRDIADKYAQIDALESAMFNKHGCPRFIPYVQLHEFETLLLVNLDQLKVMYPDRSTQINRLKRDLGELNIELVNDGATTAPSKRIINAVPDHEGQKSTVGPMVAEDIGIQAIRQRCRHFNDWLTKLENLNSDIVL